MTRPNLLIIMSDQHNPAVMGCAGDRWVQTPNLDGLAADGVRFTSAYCASPLCAPSRMSFICGQFPSDIGVCVNSGSLNPYTPTFAHSLALAGYRTVLCGRMHFSGPDQNHGFTERLVGDVSGAAQEGGRDRFEDRVPQHTCGQDYRGVVDSGIGRTSYMAYDEDVTAAACRLLEEIDRGQDDRPVCIVVGFLLPHCPYICPREWFDRYMDSLPPPANPSFADVVAHPAMARWGEVRGIANITAEDARRARAAYYGLTSYLDQLIGRIRQTLAATRLASNTVTAYCSDHGDMIGEHGIWWKDSFYEGSVTVPMIWSAPGTVAGGRIIHTPVSLLDVAPTLLELGGAEPLPRQRGLSLLSTLRGEGELPVGRPVLAEMYPNRLFPARMIRRGQWKLNHYHGYDRPQLFDLQADPREQHDLAGSPRHAELVRDLRAAALDGWSGERVIVEAEKNLREWKMTSQYAKLVTGAISERWRMPENCNDWGKPTPSGAAPNS